MIVVTPCRSDRSTLGLLPYSHLNDGRLHIVLIRSCTVLEYLRLLPSIPQTGFWNFQCPMRVFCCCSGVEYVPHVPVTAYSSKKSSKDLEIPRPWHPVGKSKNA